MAKVQIRKKEDDGHKGSAGYSYLIDGQEVTDIISRVANISLDFNAGEIPTLTIVAHADDVDVDTGDDE